MGNGAKHGEKLSSVFDDAKGRRWSLVVTVGDMIKVRKETGVDFAAALKSNSALADMIFGDPAKLVETLYCLCEQQATDAGVSPEDFGYGFDGRAIERATEALLTAVADFFPRSHVGNAIRQNLRATMERADAAAVEAIERVGSR